ncbi:ABC transporter substrate-binding protein [Streptomyces sp. DSM 44917]|uniref:ABC transporter substrate-binding protein n=1 Tax=Streptomyces boetiae TaxID=3075541 RepID=A0ABU2L9Y7_9ACTN|nr:ABC transporter substrate-binding protein [Streptomyces sp. DSM 44917]MDT0308390.1 ABC transporter substrate-binding protein [Streptomyces sp. DSM 44917]
MLRRLRPAAVAALLVGTAAACGSSEDSGSEDPAGGPAVEAEEGAFPVTIDHRFGSTTIEEQPARVVTVGLTDQDAVLALGTVPVGVTDWLGLHEGAIGPWAEEALGEAELPTVLEDPGTGPQVEEITRLDPDVIIALYAGLTEEQYDSLTRIAPVVAAPEEFEDWGIPWQDQTLLTGQALGRPQAARGLVEEVENVFEEQRAAHPEFEGETGIVATPYEGLFVYGSRDLRPRVLTDLGFTLPEDLDDAVGGEFGAAISRERTDLLDQSAAVWIVADTATGPDELHADELYADLDVVAEGREVFIGETTDYGAAFSMATVLSMPYIVERIVPQLAAAVDGDPATAVEHPAG